MSRRVAALAVLAFAAPARADTAPEPTPEPPRPQVSTGRRVGAVLAAIGPGLVVRGAGSWLVGEKRTARRLFTTAAVGAGAVVLGAAPVGLTGANAYSIWPGVPILLAGSGLFFTTWWADIATAAGLEGPGTARATAPWAVELGTAWLHDGFRDRGLVRAGGRVELGRVGVGALAMIDAEGALRAGEAELRYRFLGAPPTGAPIASGSRLVARTALRVHDDRDDGVTLVTGELELVGRLDLAWLDARLAGTFAQLSTGLGLERAGYPNDSSDTTSLLLGTFAWGAYLGDRGEAAVFYDHRRDTLPGGLAAWRAAGFLGSVGGYVDVLLSDAAPRWAVRGQLDVGSGWLTTLAIRYQGGPR